MPYLDDGSWVLHRPYVAPTLPVPLVHSVAVGPDDERVPADARRLYVVGATFASVWLTFAHGHVPGADGNVSTQDVMEPTGEMTKGTEPKWNEKTGKMTRGSKPRPETKKVGEKVRPPAESIRLVIQTPDKRLYVLHWLDGAWDAGMVIQGRTLIRNAGIRELGKEIKDAASRADMRREDRQQVLHLESDEGKPL